MFCGYTVAIKCEFICGNLINIMPQILSIELTIYWTQNIPLAFVAALLVFVMYW